MIRFQSTLLQEERRFTASWFLVKDGISIHAPTRGATCIRSLSRGLLYHFNPRSYKRSDLLHACHLVALLIFQSTLLQEERQQISFNVSYSTNFNPRSYKRSDAEMLRPGESTVISIHAPTRGATLFSRFSLFSLRFQSTLLQEERQMVHSRMHTRT